MKTISEKGAGKINEDIYGMKSNRFWVFDGASSVFDKKYFSDLSDAHFIVNLFNKKIIEIDNGEISNNDLLIACQEEIVNKHIDISKIPYYKQPSFALAMVKVRDYELEVTLLSDCYIVLIYESRIEIITDSRIKIIAEQSQECVEKLKSINITNEERKKLLKERYQKNRKLMNRENGYFVGTFDGKGFKRTLEMTIMKEGIKKVLLCTDGFYKAFNLGIVTLDILFKNDICLENIVSQLRKYEKNEPEELVKNMDDATAILLSL